MPESRRKPKRNETRRFFEILYGEEVVTSESQLVIWSKTPGKSRRTKSNTDWCETVDEAVYAVKRRKPNRDVYFGVCLQDKEQAVALAREKDEKFPESTRGKKASTRVLPALWLDLDVATGTHKAPNLPPSNKDAMELLEGIPVKPSMVVTSGGGLHVYWILKEPWELSDDNERELAENTLLRLQWSVIQAADAKDWKVDRTADLPRVMRVPGSFNRKAQPIKCEIAKHDQRRRYNPADFDVLPEPGPGPLVTQRDRGAPDPAGKPKPKRRGPKNSVGNWQEMDEKAPAADVRGVVKRCSWFRSTLKARKTLDEPSWYAQITILSRCQEPVVGLNGHELVHRASQDYLGYSEEETNQKIEHATTTTGPRTCQQISQLPGAWNNHCSQCQFWGSRVTSPIILGRGEVEDSPPPPPEMPHIDDGEPGGQRERTTIILPEAPDWDRVSTETLAAVVASENPEAPTIFKRTSALSPKGSLVSIVRTDPDDKEAFEDPDEIAKMPSWRKQRFYKPKGSPFLRSLPTPRLRSLVSSRCVFEREGVDRKGNPTLKPQYYPPPGIIEDIDSREPQALQGVAELGGVREAPFLRDDGTVCQGSRAHYDPVSRIYYLPNAAFDPVPENPTDDDCLAAVKLIEEMVCDFPFETPADKAVWVALFLTTVGRSILGSEMSPFFLLDGNREGVGKSKLVDAIAMALTGRRAPRVIYTHDDNEMQKRILSLGLAGVDFVLLDNLSGDVRSPSLEAILTGDAMRGRQLGTHEMSPVEMKATWVGTANNPVLSRDLGRRSLPCRLLSHDEKPEERGGFKHPRLLAWIASQRHRIVPAALTLIRHWINAGSPTAKVKSLGSFEMWSDTFRQVVIHHGWDDPVDARAGISETIEVDPIRAVINSLHDLFTAKKIRGATAAEILQDARQGGEEAKREASAQLPGFANDEDRSLVKAQKALYTALAEIASKSDLPSPKALGKYLQANRERWASGLCIARRPAVDAKGVIIWEIRKEERATVRRESPTFPRPSNEYSAGENSNQPQQARPPPGRNRS